MAEELCVDVKYRGLEVGRHLRMTELGSTTAFLHHGAPMPVGAILELVADGGPAIPVRVARVWEKVSDADHEPGMRIALEALSGPAKDWWAAKVCADESEPASGALAESADPSAVGAEKEQGDNRRKKRTSSPASSGDGGKRRKRRSKKKR